MSFCPECEAVIEQEFEEIGELVTCPECGVELEVVSLEPLEFDLAPLDDGEDEEDEFGTDESDDEEDWDDEETFDEEDEEEEEDEY